MTNKITITQALNELKLYDKKIEKATKANFVSFGQIGDKQKVGTKDKEEFKKDSQAALQSVLDLIENRNKMKSAIVKSNAETEVTIDDKTMTVAEAIERKTSIEYDEDLLLIIQQQNECAQKQVNAYNSNVDDEIRSLSDNNKKDDTKVLSKEELDVLIGIKEKGKKEIVSGFDADKEIAAMYDATQGFLANVDTALTLSNATTFIDVEL